MSRAWTAGVVFWLTGAGTMGSVVGQQPQGGDRPLPNYDIRDRDLPAPGGAADRQNTGRGRQPSRINSHTGALRVVDATDLVIPRGRSSNEIRNILPG